MRFYGLLKQNVLAKIKEIARSAEPSERDKAKCHTHFRNILFTITG